MRVSAVPMALVVLSLLPGWGCGSNDAAHVGTTVPVKGKVTYQGKPLTQGNIKFEPDAGREAHGTIGPDGTFVLTTFKEGDGAVVGVHRIAVSGTGKGGKEVLPPKFRNTSSSNVEVEISAGKTDYAVNLR